MALPNQIDPSTPGATTSPSLGDDQIRALKQFVCDVLGIPTTTNISAAGLEFVAAGLKTVILQDAAADPAAAGEIRRNSTLLKYHNGSAVKTLSTTDHTHSGGGAVSLAHADLTGIGTDDHHAKSHVHTADGSGTVAHSSLSGIGTDDHHAKSHVHTADGSGTVAHSSLSGLTSGDPHTQYQAKVITTRGDVIIGDSGGAASRLAIGTGMLGRSGSDVAWRVANDARGDLRAAMQPCVTMIRTSDSVNDLSTTATWVVVKPDGTLLDTTGTTTQGLQEAMTYAASNGYDLYVYGSGRKGSAPSGVNAAIISCSTALTIPVLEGVRWDIHATINFGGSGATYAMTFDSVMASTIEFHDQIVVASTYTNGVALKPTNELPSDTNGPVITSSFIALPSVVKLGTGVAIDMVATGGGISSNNIRIIEPNGGSIGIRVQVGASTLFDHNHIDVVDCHAQDTCINAGTATTNAANIYGNTWNVQCDPNTGGVGVEIFGLHELWNISVTNLEGNPTTGITLNASAKKNLIHILRNDATTKINDAATEVSNTIIAPREYLRAHKNGTDQTGVVTATLTDVTFGTEVTDSLGAFNGTTYTCQYPGAFLVIGRVGWKTPTDQAFLTTEISKNGSSSVSEYDGASGGTGNQGALVTGIISCAAGDTIKIRARHEMGSNQDIDGTGSATYIMVMRLQ